MAIPPHRQRWINDGESFVAGDRELVAVRPPTFDSPTTRGLYDPKTGVYWSSDAFGTPVLGLVDHVSELPAELWEETQMMFSSMLSPWHTVVDPVKFGGWVDRVAALQPKFIVGCHGPVISGEHVDIALDRVRGLPDAPEAVLPGQPVLDDIIAMAAAA